jgi:hypothetical protein
LTDDSIQDVGGGVRGSKAVKDLTFTDSERSIARFLLEEIDKDKSGFIDVKKLQEVIRGLDKPGAAHKFTDVDLHHIISFFQGQKEGLDKQDLCGIAQKLGQKLSFLGVEMKKFVRIDGCLCLRQRLDNWLVDVLEKSSSSCFNKHLLKHLKLAFTSTVGAPRIN